MNRPQWKAAIVFYVLACAISWPFFWWKDIHAENWDLSAVPIWARFMGLMCGPGVAALLCFAFFRRTHQRTITFWGTSKIRSACFCVLPITFLAFVHPPADRLLFGVLNDPAAHQLNPLLFIVAVLLLLCWALGEELGWRGFLQDALRPISFVWRFVLIGFLWALWHFTNFTANRPIKVGSITIAIAYPAIILLTFIIGLAVERSRSLLVAVTIHMWIDLTIHLRTERTTILFAGSILFWVVLLWTWPKDKGAATISHKG
jgi:membrane protease YdiL (CAAX protease family)